MFIELSSDLSVEVKHIEAVEAINELSCIVYTTRHSYKVNMPKNVLLSMIQSRQKAGQDSNSNVERLLQQIYSNQATPRP